jgi:hypothetical protein
VAAISDTPSPLPSNAPSLMHAEDNGNVLTFLAEFMSYCDSHYLLPINVLASNFLSGSEVLAAARNGSLEPEVDGDDDPLWSDMLASPEQEYWITGTQDKICSLQNLKVFILIPQSDVSASHQPLWGKLICKCKCNDSSKIVCYKV